MKVTLLGGDRHGETLDFGREVDVLRVPVVPKLGSSICTFGADVPPTITVREELYWRQKLVLPIKRDGWEPVPIDPLYYADRHPELIPEYSTRKIWCTDDFKAEGEERWLRVEHALVVVATWLSYELEDELPLLRDMRELRGYDAWAIYRIIRKHGTADAVSQLSAIEVELDAFDAFLAGE